MARIGFLTLYATGHLQPSMACARSLLAKGHDPVFFNVPDVGPIIGGAGLKFLAFGRDEYPAGSLQSSMQRTAELSGSAAFAHYVERMMQLFRTAFRELPALLRSASLDLLVIDQVFYAGATIAEHLGLPFISLANALLVNREDAIPPPVMLWPNEFSDAAVARNRQGWAAVDHAYVPLLNLVNRQRDLWHLPEYQNLMEDSFSTLAQICQQPAFFDFPRFQAPDTLHLVGSFRDEFLSRDVPFPWDWLDGRPLIYASCGTLQNRLEQVFRLIIRACAPLDAQTVIALGEGGLSPALFGDAPVNIKLVPYAPQRQLLERAALCITHAGLNTTLDCLEFGVPMIAVPIASEQPGIAMRAARLGACQVLPLADLNLNNLQTALQNAFTLPSYRQAAQSAAREIAKLDPLAGAANLIEQGLARSRAQSRTFLKSL